MANEQTESLPTELLDIGEVAERLRVTASTVKRWARIGRIPVLNIGQQLRRFDWAAVLAALKAMPPPKPRGRKGNRK